jgi:hypothetical protein
MNLRTRFCHYIDEFAHHVLGDADEHVIHTLGQQQQQQRQQQQQQQVLPTQTIVVAHAFEGSPEGAKVTTPWFRQWRRVYAVLLVVGMFAWFAVDFRMDLNGLVHGMSDSFNIEPRPSDGREVNKQQSICLCSYRNTRVNRHGLWVPLMVWLSPRTQPKS